MKKQKTRINRIEKQLTPKKAFFVWVQDAVGNYFSMDDYIMFCIKRSTTPCELMGEKVLPLIDDAKLGILKDEFVKRKERRNIIFLYCLLIQLNLEIKDNRQVFNLQDCLLTEMVKAILIQYYYELVIKEHKLPHNNSKKFGSCESKAATCSALAQYFLGEICSTIQATKKIKQQFFEGNNIIWADNMEVLETYKERFEKNIATLNDLFAIEPRMDIEKIKNNQEPLISGKIRRWVGHAKIETHKHFDDLEQAKSIAFAMAKNA